MYLINNYIFLKLNLNDTVKYFINWSIVFFYDIKFASENSLDILAIDPNKKKIKKVKIEMVGGLLVVGRVSVGRSRVAPAATEGLSAVAQGSRGWRGGPFSWCWLALAVPSYPRSASANPSSSAQPISVLVCLSSKWHVNFAIRGGDCLHQRLLAYRAMWRFELCGESSSLNHTRYFQLKLFIKLKVKQDKMTFSNYIK